MSKCPIKPLEPLPENNFFEGCLFCCLGKREIKRWTSIILYKLFKAAGLPVLLPESGGLETVERRGREERDERKGGNGGKRTIEGRVAGRSTTY